MADATPKSKFGATPFVPAKGQVVDVAPRTYPGMNKPGGRAKVIRVVEDDNGRVKYVDVSYILGGSEKHLELCLVSLPQEVEQRSRSRRSFLSTEQAIVSSSAKQKRAGKENGTKSKGKAASTKAGEEKKKPSDVKRKRAAFATVEENTGSNSVAKPQKKLKGSGTKKLTPPTSKVVTHQPPPDDGDAKRDSNKIVIHVDVEGSEGNAGMQTSGICTQAPAPPNCATKTTKKEKKSSTNNRITSKKVVATPSTEMEQTVKNSGTIEKVASMGEKITPRTTTLEAVLGSLGNARTQTSGICTQAPAPPNCATKTTKTAKKSITNNRITSKKVVATPSTEMEQTVKNSGTIEKVASKGDIITPRTTTLEAVLKYKRKKADKFVDDLLASNPPDRSKSNPAVTGKNLDTKLHAKGLGVSMSRNEAPPSSPEKSSTNKASPSSPESVDLEVKIDQKRQSIFREKMSQAMRGAEDEMAGEELANKVNALCKASNAHKSDASKEDIKLFSHLEVKAQLQSLDDDHKIMMDWEEGNLGKIYMC